MLQEEGCPRTRWIMQTIYIIKKKGEHWKEGQKLQARWINSAREERRQWAGPEANSLLQGQLKSWDVHASQYDLNQREKYNKLRNWTQCSNYGYVNCIKFFSIMKKTSLNLILVVLCSKMSARLGNIIFESRLTIWWWPEKILRKQTVK